MDYVVYTLHPAAAHSAFAVLLQPLGPGAPVAGPPADAGAGAAWLQGAQGQGQGQQGQGQGQPGQGQQGQGQGQQGQGQQGQGQAASEEEDLPGVYHMSWLDLQITSRVVSTVCGEGV